MLVWRPQKHKHLHEMIKNNVWKLILLIRIYEGMQNWNKKWNENFSKSNAKLNRKPDILS